MTSSLQTEGFLITLPSPVRHLRLDVRVENPRISLEVRPLIHKTHHESSCDRSSTPQMASKEAAEYLRKRELASAAILHEVLADSSSSASSFHTP